MLKLLDIFSGIGGFTIAGEAAGLTTIGFSEIEPYACKVLKRHWPHIPNYGDIRNIPTVQADIIAGGPPCQPASCAGKRRGKEDQRWLWPAALAVVERIRPTFCLFENPAGILSLNGGVEFEGVLSKLESFGYSVQPIVIPAVAVDARHRRDRVWIVAHASSLRREQCSEWKHIGEENERWLPKSVTGGLPVANSECIGRNKMVEPIREGTTRKRAAGEAEYSSLADGWTRWLPEPELGRVADGIPHRAHRLKGLGNAIVPQVAEMIFRKMLA